MFLGYEESIFVNKQYKLNIHTYILGRINQTIDSWPGQYGEIMSVNLQR